MVWGRRIGPVVADVAGAAFNVQKDIPTPAECRGPQLEERSGLLYTYSYTKEET